MLPTAGFGWTVRTMALVQISLAIVCRIYQVSLPVFHMPPSQR